MGIACVAAIYIPIAPDFLRALLAFRGVVLYPAISLTVLYCLESPRDLRHLLRVVVCAGAVTTLYGILQHFFAFDQGLRGFLPFFSLRQMRFEVPGVMSTFPGRPDFGGYLVALTLLVWLVPLWKLSSVGRALKWLLLTGTLTCLFWTYSRTSWVALLVGVSVALLLRNKVRAMVGLLVLGVLIGWFYDTRIEQISEDAQQATTDYGSGLERLKLWQEASQLVYSNPLGYGLGTVGGALLTETPERDLKPQENLLLVTDNAFLKLLVQGGLPLAGAFLIFFGLIIRLILIILRTLHDPWRKDVAVWASASFASLLVILSTVDYMEATTSIAIYWLAVGVVAWQASLLHPGQPRPFQPSLRPEGFR
jgi:hypothetical protein